MIALRNAARSAMLRSGSAQPLSTASAASAELTDLQAKFDAMQEHAERLERALVRPPSQPRTDWTREQIKTICKSLRR